MFQLCNFGPAVLELLIAADPEDTFMPSGQHGIFTGF